MSQQAHPRRPGLPVLVPYARGPRGTRTAEAPSVFADYLVNRAGTYRAVDNAFFASRRLLDLDAEDADRRVLALCDEAAGSATAPVFFGGDHALTYPVLRALCRRHASLALIVLDAHSDVQGDEAELRNWNVMRKIAADFGQSVDIVHIGFRDQDGGDLGRHAACVVTTRDLVTAGHAFSLARIRAAVAGRPIYLSVDLDVLEPTSFGAVTAPISGGLSVAQLLALIDDLADQHVVAADIVEYDPRQPAALDLLTLADIFWHVEALCDQRSRIPRR